MPLGIVAFGVLCNILGRTGDIYFRNSAINSHPLNLASLNYLYNLVKTNPLLEGVFQQIPIADVPSKLICELMVLEESQKTHVPIGLDPTKITEQEIQNFKEKKPFLLLLTDNQKEELGLSYEPKPVDTVVTSAVNKFLDRHVRTLQKISTAIKTYQPTLLGKSVFDINSLSSLKSENERRALATLFETWNKQPVSNKQKNEMLIPYKISFS